MHTSTTSNLIPPPLPSIPYRNPRVARSPYPVTRKPMAPVTPGRKAYNHLKSMLSSFKPSKGPKRTARETRAVGTQSDEGRASGGQLAPGHANDTRVERPKMGQAFIHVYGDQLAPGYVSTSQPREVTTFVDEYYGWAQVAKTSARFLSTLLGCPETLPSTDPASASPDLAHFIAFALSQSLMPLCVHQYALHLIWRVKYLNPEFQPRHAHGTYLTALMLAAKQSCDGEYPIGDWAAIGQHIFEPSQLRENEWRMCERLGWRFLVHPTDLVKLVWTIEVEYGELMEGAPPSSTIQVGSGLGCSGMFASSVASSLSSISTSSSCSLDSPWSGWGQATPCGSSFSTPAASIGPTCGSYPSPFVLA